VHAICRQWNAARVEAPRGAGGFASAALSASMPVDAAGSAHAWNVRGTALLRLTSISRAWGRPGERALYRKRRWKDSCNSLTLLVVAAIKEARGPERQGEGRC
jgi:hypothetical protein